MRSMLASRILCAPLMVALVGLAACSAGNNGGGTTGTTGTQAGGSAGAGTGGAGAGGTAGVAGDLGVGGDLSMTGSGGAGGMINCVPGGPDDDVDGDGYTPNQGDCEDCDPDRNPNALEVMTPPGGTPYDEDCDGQIDEDDSVLCDDSLAIDDMDPLTAARAIELCKTSADGVEWGVVSAKWVLADGTTPKPFDEVNFHLGHGLLTGFGPNVQTRAGARLLALSSGSARQPNDPGYHDVGGFSKGYTCGHPQGFPKESPACPGTITGQPNDATGVEIEIRPPSNAKGFSFDFKFQTYEWPNYVCSQYNDFFVALLMPFPAGQTDGNIAFDKMGNPVSVNNAFIEVCGCPGNPPSACLAGGKTFDCPLGDFELLGTGFGFDSCSFCQDHGGTGWLRTSAPIDDPKQNITMRFAVYDSGDGVLDTTTLIDNWLWIAKPGVTVGTDTVPE